MASDTAAPSPAAEKTTRTKAYVPDSEKDYDLTSIRIGEAENGVVVECGYSLKQSVKDKMSKASQAMGNGSYISDYCEPEKHVFEDKQKAKEFIMSELDGMWGDGGSDDGDDD